MNKRLIFTTLALGAMAGAQAQINAPDAEGCIFRGIEMLRDANAVGAVDQLREATRLGADNAEIQRLTAMSELELGRYQRARQLLEEFLSDHPASTWREDVRMAIGDTYLNSSYALALKEYKKVDPAALSAERAEDLTYRKGWCMLKLADFDGAQACFQQLASSKRYGNAARFYQGYIAYCKRDYRTAKQILESVNTSTAPGDMATYFLAQIYYAEGDWSRALTTARAAARRSDADPVYVAEANRIAGESLFRLDRQSEAIPYIKKYVSAVENPLPSALYILGVSQYDEGDLDASVKTLRAVTSDESAMGQNAYLYIGQALMKLGDSDGAIMAFDRASKMPYDDGARENAYYNYAVAKYKGGRVPFGSSVSTFEDFLTLYPDSKYADEVRQYIVTGYLADKNYDAALASINRAKNPSDKILAAKQQVLYQIGAKELAAGDANTAVTRLREAKSLSKYNSEVARETSLTLGEALYRTGDLNGAVSELSSYVSATSTSVPNRAVAQYDLGYAQLGLKNWQDAQSAFEQVTANPGNLGSDVVADAWNRVGDCLYYQRDWSGAANAYASAYKTAPKTGDYSLFHQAVMKGYQNDYATKYSLLTRFEKEFPKSTLMPDAMLEMSEALVNLNRPDDAIDTWQDLISRYGSTAQGRQAYLQMAMTQVSKGDRKTAMQTYRDVIRLYPTSDEAAQAVETLKRMCADDGTLDEFASFIKSVDNAPAITTEETERLKFNSAEQAYLTTSNITRLSEFVKVYPNGAYSLAAWAHIMNDAVNRVNDDDAWAAADAIIKGWPDNSAVEDALALKADIEADRGQGELALADYKALAQRASTTTNRNAALIGIMRVTRDMGLADDMFDAADAVLASSTIGSEERTEAAFSRGLALQLKGDDTAARETWSSLASLTDDAYGAKSAVYLAESLLKAGKNEDAAKVAEAFVNSGTPHTYWLGRGFITLSDISRARGRDFEADEYLKALRENYPGNETDIFEMIDQRLKK